MVPWSLCSFQCWKDLLPPFAYEYSTIQACREAQRKRNPFLFLDSTIFFSACMELRLTGRLIGYSSGVLLTPEQKSTDALNGGPLSAVCKQSCCLILGQLYKKDWVNENEVADLLACLLFSFLEGPGLYQTPAFFCIGFTFSMSQKRQGLKINI